MRVRSFSDSALSAARSSALTAREKWDPRRRIAFPGGHQGNPVIPQETTHPSPSRRAARKREPAAGIDRFGKPLPAFSHDEEMADIRVKRSRRYC